MKNKSAGLTLIELLIAMVLGLSVAAGVIQIYVGNTATERSQEARSRLQENGRFALHFLAQEVRMGGYLGCLGGLDESTVNNTINAPPNTFQPETGVQGWEASGTRFGAAVNRVNDASLLQSNAGGWASTAGNVLPLISALPNSDIIRIWSATGTPAIINSVTQGITPVLNIDSIDIDAGDILLLSDCELANWVQACDVAPIGGAATANVSLSTDCSPGNRANILVTAVAGGEAVKLGATLLYVGKRGNLASNPPALFRRQLGANASVGPAEELIEGVESMQIVYGVNLDADLRNTVDAYLAANQVPHWQAVISVRISLLMQSVENGIVPSPQAFTFFGANYDGANYDGANYDGAAGGGQLPGDNRARRVFNTTINLRNRALGM